MSEENEAPTIDTMLDAIYQKNLSQARHHFDTMMADKIGDALENEKISIASQYYKPEVEYDESEVPQDEDESIDETEYDEYEASAEESEESEDDWGDLEQQVSKEFEEELEV